MKKPEKLHTNYVPLLIVTGGVGEDDMVEEIEKVGHDMVEEEIEKVGQQRLSLHKLCGPCLL